MAEASVAMRVEDNLSSAITGMKNAVTPFRKDINALQTELTRLNATKVSMRMDLDGAKRELREAERAFRNLGDEQSRQAVEAAGYNAENIKDQLAMVSKQAKQTQKDMMAATGAISKADNKAAKMTESVGLGALGKAGLGQLLGQSFAGAGNALVSSSFGSETGTMFSSALSGAISGAALGSLAGPLGTAIGGAVGGAAGLITGGTQVFERKDDAFKGYVQQQTEGTLATRSSDITSGSAIAAGREQDAIAFNTMLGEGVGDRYLSDLREMAAKTPMEYADLTGMSRNLATGFKDDPARMLGLMESIGNAGSAVGVDPAGMSDMAKALSQMQASGKVTREKLDILQDRGVDVVGMLAEDIGITKGEVYDRITRGELSGAHSVDVIEAGMDRLYGGAMDWQSRTFSGLASTLSDAEKEMQNAYGEGYNEERGAGLTAQTDWLSGVSGTAQQEANAAIGAWQASLENAKEGYLRDAADSAMASTEYQTAKAQGDAAEMGRLMMESKVAGMNRYNASEGAQQALESDLALAGAIREDAGSNKAYWDAGYRKSQEFSKGLGQGLLATASTWDKSGDGMYTPGVTEDGYYDSSGSYRAGSKPMGSHAAGLGRVPYDNYLALLHEGERVQTAREVRSEGQGGGVKVTITGCDWTIREDADVDRIAGALAEAIGLKVMAGR